MSDPLPANRTPAHTGSWVGIAGIPGGIPNRTTVYQTVTPGMTTSAIQDVIWNCPPNQVVMMADGNFGTTEDLVLYVSTQNITLRGSGNTILNRASIIIGNSLLAWNVHHDNPASGNHTNITAGATHGSTQITLANITGYAVGQQIIIDQLNDANSSLVGVEGVTGYAYSSVAFPITGQDRIKHQITFINAIAGNVVTLADPLYDDYTLTPQAWHMPTNQAWAPFNTGVENVKINGIARLSNAHQCWFYNCNIDSHGSGDLGYIMSLWSGRCQIDSCVLSPASSYEDYGIEPRSSSGLLVQNNIINNVGVPLQISGCSGSVFAYNYLDNVYSSSSWMSQGILNHGGFPWMTLIEGNVGPTGALDNTDSPSWCNTMHRNWFQGIDKARTAIGNIEAIWIGGQNRDCTVTGNVLGTSGVTYNVYEVSTSCVTGQKRIYGVGLWAAECGAPYDATTTSTLIRGYNWDQFNNGIVAGGFVAGDIPASRYLTAKPSWFGSLTWPPIDPANPTYSRSSTNIPAGQRFIGSPVTPVSNTSSFGNSLYDLWYKIAKNTASIPPVYGDSQYTLLCKIAGSAAGSYEYDLLYKTAVNVGASPVYGEYEYSLLQKIANKL